MTASLRNNFVEGLKGELFQTPEGFYLAVAISLRDGRLPVVALDAEFCLNLKVEMDRLIAAGMVDVEAQLGDDEAFRRADLLARSQGIPHSVFLQDIHQAVADERSVNLLPEEGFIELDVILRSGWEATVWFDAVASHALALVIHDAI